eukprot:scaffold22056_cov113-Isochrysis_galbana.AAC.13
MRAKLPPAAANPADGDPPTAARAAAAPAPTTIRRERAIAGCCGSGGPTKHSSRHGTRLVAGLRLGRGTRIRSRRDASGKTPY